MRRGMISVTSRLLHSHARMGGWESQGTSRAKSVSSMCRKNITARRSQRGTATKRGLFHSLIPMCSLGGWAQKGRVTACRSIHRIAAVVGLSHNSIQAGASGSQSHKPEALVQADEPSEGRAWREGFPPLGQRGNDMRRVIGHSILQRNWGH